MLEHYNVKAAELKGTEKQIKWAEEIRENLIEQVNERTVTNIHHLFTMKTEKVMNFINELKELRTENEYLNTQIVINRIRQLIASEENALTFIDNRSLLSFLNTILS
jgi:hypothetical protein